MDLPAASVLLVSFLFEQPLLPPPLPASHFLQTTTAMARKKITGDELSARAKANGYQRGAHRHTVFETAISMCKVSQKTLMLHLTRPPIFVSYSFCTMFQ